MVVLSLVLGLSEQDDFANIPDLQNPGTQQNQNAQGDRRYALRRGPAVAAAELDEAVCLPWMLEREDGPSPGGALTHGHPGGVPWV